MLNKQSFVLRGMMKNVEFRTFRQHGTKIYDVAGFADTDDGKQRLTAVSGTVENAKKLLRRKELKYEKGK